MKSNGGFFSEKDERVHKRLRFISMMTSCSEIKSLILPMTGRYMKCLLFCQFS